MNKNESSEMQDSKRIVILMSGIKILANHNGTTGEYKNAITGEIIPLNTIRDWEKPKVYAS